MVYKRRKYHYGDTHLKRRWRTKRRTKDLDQIDQDIRPENADRLLNQEVDLDKPGSAQFYCLHCARYFVSDHALQDHFKTKVHKRRLKALELEPYSIEDSERAAGFGNFKNPEKRKIETQTGKEETEEEPVAKKSKMNRIYFFSNLASKALIITKFNRLFSSALYITGDKAHKTYAVVTPILDFEERLKNKLELEENIKLRCLNIDLEAVEKRWVFYKHLNEQKENLEFTRSEIGKEITRLIKNENETQNVEKFKVHAKLVKEELKLLKDYLYGVEESSVLKVLSLPNILHPNTPKTSEETFYSFLEKPLTKSSSHMELGSDLILCLNPYLYYLKGDAAFFELSLTEFVRNALIDFSFIQFCTSDFSRSVVIEGCGTNFQNKLEVFTLEKIHTDSNHGEYNRLHLTGGASLYSFMAYFTRNLVLESYLPLKLFSCGRKYQPQNSQILDLFNSTQETAVEVFIATRDHDDLNLKFKELVEKIIDIYQTFECHFRLSYLPPNKLKTYESLRLSIQMYSCHLEKYVEVGHISICDDFLSKRLLFSYNSNKERKFPKIISATLIRVQPLLACLLEYGKFNKSNIHFNLENIQRK